MTPWKLSSLLIGAGFAVVLVIISADAKHEASDNADVHASTFERYVDEAGNIKLPENFVADWVHMGAWAVAEGEKVIDLHNVYAPQEVIDYYREHEDFADGAIMVKEVRNARGAPHTTGDAFWATDVKVWFVMVRDTTGRFPDNPLWGEGWGWALFEGGNPNEQVATDYESDCLGCHVPVEKTHWIYVYAYPVLGASVEKHAPPVAEESGSAEGVQGSPGQAAVEEMTASAELLERGGKVFKRCKSCHSLEPGKHRTGPSLAGVFGREAGTVEGYKYSDAMLESKVIWSVETLDQHLADVPGFIPGNRMGQVFKGGVKKPYDRTAVIEFLRSSSQ